MSTDKSHARAFKSGDNALLVDKRGRRYLVQLDDDSDFHTHLGHFSHNALIGQPEGSRILTSKDHSLLAVKPTMADFSVHMPRIATVVYPKDLGAVIVLGDIFPGATVLEAGSGSGAMTIALARAVGSSGRVVSYDLRKDMSERASKNLRSIMPDHSWVSFKLGDVYTGFEETEFDRIVLDLPEPWHVVPHAFTSLVPGGILTGFVPSVVQLHEFVHSLKTQDSFALIETVEILLRPWETQGRSIRPSHRMVGHTGFITTARKCSPK